MDTLWVSRVHCVQNRKSDKIVACMRWDVFESSSIIHSLTTSQILHFSMSKLMDIVYSQNYNYFHMTPAHHFFWLLWKIKIFIYLFKTIFQDSIQHRQVPKIIIIYNLVDSHKAARYNYEKTVAYLKRGGGIQPYPFGQNKAAMAWPEKNNIGKHGSPFVKD